MLAKKIAVLIAAAALSAPSFADRSHRDGPRHGHGYGHGNSHRVVHPHVVHRPVVRHTVVHHYHRPAPQPVYVVQRRSHGNAGIALLAGAVIGAVIVSAATGAH